MAKYDAKKLWLLIFGTIAIAYVMSAARQYEPYGFLLFDCPYYAASAISIAEDGDILLDNQIHEFPQQVKEAIHRWHLHVSQQKDVEKDLFWGFTALGKDGEIYPKHSFLISAFSFPFYMAFGYPGFLIFNIFAILLLVFATWKLVTCFVQGAPAILAVFFLALLSFLKEYVYYLSPDVFSSLLVITGLWLLFKKEPKPVFSKIIIGVLAGVLAGLAVWAKLSNVIFLPFFFLIALRSRGTRVAMFASASAMAALCAFMYLNYDMFGSPFITSYDRVIIYVNDTIKIQQSHRSMFDVPLLKGAFGQIFSKNNGLLFTAPFCLFGLAGFWALFKKKRWSTLIILLMMVAQFLFYSTFHFWQASHYGNRFLMTFLCLSTIPLAQLFTYFLPEDS